MAGVGQARYRRLVVAGLLSATLVACGRAAPVEIGMSGLPPAAAATTSFQGQVASVDLGSGIAVVDVQIIWTPVLTAHRHERKVLVDAGTRWEPASPASGLSGLKVGEEIQVEAVEAVEGVWPAVLVQLFDVD